MRHVASDATCAGWTTQNTVSCFRTNVHQAGGDLTYASDPTGNRIGTGGSFARTLIPTAVPAGSYDPANQQLAFGAVNQTFDANGNLLTQTDPSGTITYTWDARNRLTAINGPATSASFTYDALGRRVSKTINGVTTTYQYDGLDIVREDGGAGEAAYLRTLSIDETLARTDSTGTATYLTDILGSTLALTDASGALGTMYTHAPFGETAVSGLPSSNPFQFTGRENDGTGLYFYRARFYDPIRSRFIREDPIGSAGGDVNLYNYVADNPLIWTDPEGKSLWIAGIVVAVGVPAFIVYLIYDCLKNCSEENPCNDPLDPNRGANLSKCLDRCVPFAQFFGANTPKGGLLKLGSEAGKAVGRARSNK
jgi:RHS repeat-associated protein